MTDKERFAPPVSKLGDPALGSLNVAAYPTAGQGLALGADGRVPADAMPSSAVIADVYPTNGSNIDILGIPQTFKHLRLIVWGRETAATTVNDLSLRFNNDNGANYNSEAVEAVGNVASGVEIRTQTFASVGWVTGASAALSTLFGATDVLIPNYTDASSLRVVFGTGYALYGAVSPGQVSGTRGGAWQAAAVNRITLINNFALGSRATLYGL